MPAYERVTRIAGTDRGPSGKRSRDTHQRLFRGRQLAPVIATPEQVAIGVRCRRSVIRLFCVCAERRPDCSCEAVFCLFQVCKIPDDGGQVVGIEMRALFVPSGFLTSVDYVTTQPLAKSGFPVGSWATVRQVGDDKAGPQNSGSQLIINKASGLSFGKQLKLKTGAYDGRAEAFIHHTIEIALTEFHGHESRSALDLRLFQALVSLPSAHCKPKMEDTAFLNV
jgi:hypothetical protein